MPLATLVPCSNRHQAPASRQPHSAACERLQTITLPLTNLLCHQNKTIREVHCRRDGHCTNHHNTASDSRQTLQVWYVIQQQHVGDGNSSAPCTSMSTNSVMPYSAATTTYEHCKKHHCMQTHPTCTHPLACNQSKHIVTGCIHPQHMASENK